MIYRDDSYRPQNERRPTKQNCISELHYKIIDLWQIRIYIRAEISLKIAIIAMAMASSNQTEILCPCVRILSLTQGNNNEH